MAHLSFSFTKSLPSWTCFSFYLAVSRGNLLFCIHENKGSDQLHGHRPAAAEQYLCLCYIDSTNPNFLSPKFQAFSYFRWLYSPVCVGPGLKPWRQVFSQPCSFTGDAGHIWALAWENQQCGFCLHLTQTRLYSHWRWLEPWNLVCRKKTYYTIQEVKTKALISFAVTAKLICVFVFSHVKNVGFLTLGLIYHECVVYLWSHFSISSSPQGHGARPAANQKTW